MQLFLIEKDKPITRVDDIEKLPEQGWLWIDATVQEPGPVHCVNLSAQKCAFRLHTCDGQQSAAEVHSRAASRHCGGSICLSQYQRSLLFASMHS